MDFITCKNFAAETVGSADIPNGSDIGLAFATEHGASLSIFYRVCDRVVYLDDESISPRLLFRPVREMAKVI